MIFPVTSVAGLAFSRAFLSGLMGQITVPALLFLSSSSPPPLLLLLYFPSFLSLMICRFLSSLSISSSIESSPARSLFSLLTSSVPAANPLMATALALLDFLVFIVSMVVFSS